VLTELTVAVNPALVCPAGILMEAGTVTAELLLERATVNPPLAAAVFNVAVQLSVPAPVMDPLEQVSPVSTGTPVPLNVMEVEVPVDELLVRVSDPEAAPATVGSNCTVSVAV
jgi:predicted permease